MELWKLEPGKPATPMAADERLPVQGFAWLDLTYEEVDAGYAEIERLTGVRVLASIPHQPDARSRARLLPDRLAGAVQF